MGRWPCSRAPLMGCAAHIPSLLALWLASAGGGGVRIHLILGLVLVRGVGVGLGSLIGTTVQLSDPTLPGLVLGGLDRLVCGAVVMSSGQLGRCHGVDDVSEVEARDLAAQSRLEGTGSAYPVGVDSGSQLQGFVGLVLHQRPTFVLGEGLVNLEETAFRGADEAPGLAAMQDQVAVVALEAQTRSVW